MLETNSTTSARGYLMQCQHAGKLCETQQREVAAIIGSFYDESRVNPNKDPWEIDNPKNYLDP